MAVLLIGNLYATEYAFVVTTDYWSAAYYSTIEILPPRATQVSISPVSTDPVAYYDYAEDMIFVVNRYLADNIQIVKTGPSFPTIGQYGVGNGSNPHDIRLASNLKAYVSRFEWKTLLVVQPYCGDSLGVIDLSSLADADGIPEMDRMEIVGDRLFVSLNSIDRTTWLPDGPGKIAVIDTQADTLIDCDPDLPGVQPIILELPNPYSELRYDPCRQELVVACLGAWGTLDGGVELIDPFTLKSKGVLISESQIGGDISDAVLAPWNKGFAVVLEAVAWPDNFARLVAFDTATGEVTDTLYQQTSGSGSSLAGIELNRQLELYLCDRDLIQPGIRIFDAATDTLIDFIDVGLPPFDIAFLQQHMAGQEEPPGSTTWTLGCYPNPFRDLVTVTYAIPEASGSAGASLEIYDALGRSVRTWTLDAGSPGTHCVRWDGKDPQGRSLASGVYFCRLGLGPDWRTQRLLLLR